MSPPMFTQMVPLSVMYCVHTSLQEGLQPGVQITAKLGAPVMVTVPVPGVPTGLPSITVSVWLITVTIARRSVLPAFAGADTVKEPGPVPLPLEIVNQVPFDAADHTHPVPVETLMVALPPPEGMLMAFADKV